MIKLIKNEFIKILHKKSTWISFIIFLGFILLINFVYTIDLTNFNYSSIEIDRTLNDYQTSIDTLDKISPYYNETYADYLAEIDTYTLLQKYHDSEWKYNLITSEYSNYRNEYYSAKYVTKNKIDIDLYERKSNNIEKVLEQDNWQEYVNMQIVEIKQLLDKQTSALKTTINEKEIESINREIEYNNYLLYLLQYRLDNNVNYDKSYLDDAINSATIYKREIINTDTSNLTNDENKAYEQTNELLLKAEYALEHKEDVNSYHSLKYMVEYYFDEFSFLIIVFIILISAAIVSDEYSKGTIKSLLITPYSRYRIIIAKFITSIIYMLLLITLLFIYELIIGGLIYGFDSLSLPVLVYNFTSQSLATSNVFSYWLISLAAIIPFYLMILLIAFTLSTVLTNTGGAITITFLTYLGSSIINAIAETYNIWIFRYIISLNWNFNQYLFCNTPTYSHITLPFSIIIYIIYFVILLGISIIVFKKRDIKNI